MNSGLYSTCEDIESYTNNLSLTSLSPSFMAVPFFKKLLCEIKSLGHIGKCCSTHLPKRGSMTGSTSSGMFSIRRGTPELTHLNKRNKAY